MPENDIYNSKRKYEDFVKNVKRFLIPPEERENSRTAKYYCKNKENLKYFYKLFDKWDALDVSYIRRGRILCVVRLVCFVAEKDLKDLDRDDIDKIVAFMHSTHKSLHSKEDFIKVLKRMWRLLFPEIDEKGRIDETICPYPVRHLKNNGDKSREKARPDKLTWDEFERILSFFSDRPEIQAYLTLAIESLGRPQEVLYTKIKDLELYDNYAKLNISEHGKEGIGFLQVIDSFPYMLRWYKQHPLRKDENAYIFINNRNKQLTPFAIRKLLKIACKHLGIDKPVTAYSLKRNGVTFARLRGESDVEIQHKARWSSTRQLKTYDMSNIEDSFKMSLAKKGLIKDKQYDKFMPKTKACPFCGFTQIGFNEEVCPECLHIVDKDKLRQNIKHEEELSKFFDVETMQKLFKTVYKLQKQMEDINTKNE